jgi:hypothetical protein
MAVSSSEVLPIASTKRVVVNRLRIVILSTVLYNKSHTRVINRS